MCVVSVLSFHDYKCAPTQKLYIFACLSIHAWLNGVCLCVGCGQLPCVHRGEVVPDTTGAVLLPQPGGVSTLR